jgi:phosphoribosylaminoimidazole-succinocarboxamide synthase
MNDLIIKNLKLLNQGKVREVYDYYDKLLIVVSDRISAFDVIMNQKIFGKGKILNTISKFWFQKTKHIIDNHFISTNIEDVRELDDSERDYLEDRAMLVKKCTPLPVEFVVRGYLAGSGWKEYLDSSSVCGIRLREGLLKYSKLPEPIFTPSTKSNEGHDENIDYLKYVEILGKDTADYLRDISIKLYNYGHDYLEQRGIILADTKFEFGIYNNEIILIDEVMTPDSSRFWLKDKYKPGEEQYNFDKQILRDYLESINWDKEPPPPELPKEIIFETMNKYKEALTRLLS